MKRQFLLLIAIAVFATALTTNAYGQTGKELRANVKFQFQIGDRIFPAGEYQIESTSRQNDNILLIRSVGDASKIQIIRANHLIAGKGQSPKLFFQKYGENYFLTQIFLDTDQRGYSIPPSRRHRENKNSLASRLPRNH